jgi:NitT/TauT family transport system substrate-binding protein
MRTWTRPSVLPILAALLLTLVAALGGPAPAAAQRQPDKVTLRLDWINSGYHALWYYAKDKGVFAEHGIELEVLEGRGSDLTAQTVGNGSVMFGTADAGAVISLASQGLPVKIVGSYFRTTPLAAIFPKKHGWKAWKDMAGATVGYGALLAPIPAALKNVGLEGKLRLTKMEPAAVPASLLEGRVDAIFSFGFLQVPVLEAKGLPVSTLSIADAGINVPGLALITNRDMIAKNPDLVRRFITAAQKSLDAVQKDAPGALEALLKRSPSLDRAAHLRILELSFPLFHSAASRGRPLAWTPPADIDKAQEILIPFGAVKSRQPIETYFTNEFVPGA